MPSTNVTASIQSEILRRSCATPASLGGMKVVPNDELERELKQYKPPFRLTDPQRGIKVALCSAVIENDTLTCGTRVAW